ncbi:MAG: hypothetical protein QOD32_2971 [Pyrinomonadaceae bacterium]|jgi:hypothetical protein|nr:hypothetical protein [Pyrinomonadaceae bacterium]
MSDYLWDKTGEPEDDVAQLENLLGALKYQPRPLDIPADAMPQTATTRSTPMSIFSRPRFALAASLLLTLLAGAWLITRDGESPTKELAKVEQGGTTSESKRTEAATAAIAPNAATPKSVSVDNAVAPKPRENKAIVVAAAAKTHRPSPRQLVARRQKLTPRVDRRMNAPLEEVAANGTMRWQVERPMTPQQREATEQLMLALRLASAKLNYAQREMLEIGRSGK